MRAASQPNAAGGPTQGWRRPGFLSRRSLQIALGALWLLDGALQLQSFMFTDGFAKTVIAPSAMGQPSFVASVVEWNARLIAGHPVALDIAFAATQLVLGLGFLFRRTVKPAVVASVLWALGVWYLGEGLGGMAGGHGSALTGAPGAALLYAVLAVAAWPPRRSASLNERGSEPPPTWTLRVWAVLWVGFAALSALPANRASGLTDTLTSNALAVPHWLASIDRALASSVHSSGDTSVVLFVILELAVGLLALTGGQLPRAALLAGIAVSLFLWAVGQSFGQLFSGQATDPNAGPLVILLGLAALGSTCRPRSTAIWSIKPHDDHSEKSRMAA